MSGSVVPHVPARVLLIGWTDILYTVLQELDAHAMRGTEVTILSNVNYETTQQRMESHQLNTLKNLTLEFLEGNAVIQSAWEDIELPGFQSIVVLADGTDEQGGADTRTLQILLRLSDLRKQHESLAHTVVELLDDNNRALLTGLDVDDIIVSPEVVSAQLAQIAGQEVLAPIYRELLSAGGVEISMRPAGDYVQLNNDCSFNDIIYACQQKMEIALGLRLARNGGELLMNPSRRTTWQLGEHDKMIVLAQQVYQ